MFIKKWHFKTKGNAHHFQFFFQGSKILANPWPFDQIDIDYINHFYCKLGIHWKHKQLDMLDLYPLEIPKRSKVSNPRVYFISFDLYIKKICKVGGKEKTFKYHIKKILGKVTSIFF